MAINVSLDRLQLSDALELPRVVADTPDLSVDFPGIPRRYSNPVRALISIKQSLKNPKLKAFTINVGDENHEPQLSGMATLCDMGSISVVGYNKLSHEPYLIQGHNIADWLCKSARGEGAGALVAEKLVEMALELDAEDAYATPWTLARPENIKATSRILSLGAKAVGTPGNYNDQVGDGVTTDRQLFYIPKKRR